MLHHTPQDVRAQIAPGVTQAVPGAQVTATLGAQSFGGTAGTSGRYSITGTTQRDGLVAGTWTVTAAATGYTATGGGVSVSVPVPELVPPSAMTVTAPDVVLTPNPGELVVYAVPTQAVRESIALWAEATAGRK